MRLPLLRPLYVVYTLLLVVILCSCVSIGTHAASGAARKAYSPFDEPKRNIPNEILTDKRLDQKVKVFAKDRNLRQLFADLSATTGVEITAAHDVCDERVIIFFHGRPLRDVMTELSGLCGYHWMVTGKSGSYDYELFEDTRREGKRASITAAIKAEQEETLLDFTETLARGGPDADAALERLKLADSDAYGLVTSPQGKNVSEMLNQLGTGLLIQALANQPAGCRVGDLPPEAQDAIFKCMHDTLPGVTPGDMPDVQVKVERIVPGADGMPRLNLGLSLPNHGSMGIAWPPVSGDGMRRAVDRPVAEDVVGETSFPEDQKIAVDKLRWLPHARGLLFGDLLEAIAVQSGRDVIADYYLQNEYVGAVRTQPLEKAIRMICKTFLYTCQVSGQTMRFRNNKWYAQDTLHEPPSQVVEHLWATLAQTGQLGMRDLTEMASLKDEQLKWPGFRFIPGVDDAQEQPYLVRLWGSLSLAQEEKARSAEGLPVSELRPDQEDRMDAWMAAQKVDVSAEDVDKAVVLVTTSHPEVKEQPGGGVSFSWSNADQERGATSLRTSRGAKNLYAEVSQSVFECLCLRYPSKLMVPASIRLYKPLDEQERKEIIAQRKADKDAEKTELVQ